MERETKMTSKTRILSMVAVGALCAAGSAFAQDVQRPGVAAGPRAAAPAAPVNRGAGAIAPNVGGGAFAGRPAFQGGGNRGGGGSPPQISGFRGGGGGSGDIARSNPQW